MREDEMVLRVIDVEAGMPRRVSVANGRFSAVSDLCAGDAVDGWALPGLVDVHNHLSMASPAADTAEPHARARASASIELALGVLAIREPGSPDDGARALTAETGWPRITTMGRFLSPPGRYFPGARPREVVGTELIEAAVDEADRNDGWAKIIGDFIDDRGHFVPNWSCSLLADAVAAVHERGGRVAIHVLCRDGVDDAVAAGVDSIEHGWAVNEQHFDEMREKGVAWVPTLIEGGAHTACAFAAATGVHRADIEWLELAVAAQPEVVARAHAAGVLVLAGTDAGQGPHGRIVEQLELIAAGGMANRDALGAGSWRGRRYLGLAGIEQGAPADIVVYDDDPTLDLDTLRRPSMIVLDGDVVLDRLAATR